MKYIYFFLMIGVLNAYLSNADRANMATQALNTKSQNSNDQSSDHPDLSKIIESLTKIRDDLKAQNDKFPSVLTDFSANRSLRQYDKDDAIINLRKILNLYGYLTQASDSTFFDLELETAVKIFQADHCLENDGVVGEGTKERLNWSFAKRIKLLDETLEKLKNLIFTERTVIANIPTYTLVAFNNKKQKMCMKIIVGKFERQTPEMTSYIDAVEFNPAWIIPKTILFQDKLPSMQHDPTYFEKTDLHVFDQDRNEVDPSEIEWNDYNENNFPFFLVQPPGSQNALGRFKFNLRNDDLIFMHDTSRPDLFKSASRALSSGCIRLEKPSWFAKWLLRMNKNELQENLEDGVTKTTKLPHEVMVYVTYLPVWLTDEGKPLWGNDPYGREKNAATTVANSGSNAKLKNTV